MALTDRLFVLGLGAQKAGTSWLHRYLDSFAIADFGLCKEYHVWDALRIPACREFLTRRRDYLRMYKGLIPLPDRGAMLRRRLQSREGAYEAYFAGLARRYATRNPGAARFMTGDITPAYCGLAASDLAEIRHRLEGEGFRLKLVFLMRDPVERCWSAVRMMQRNARSRASDEANLKALYRTEGYEFRTRYDQTIASIEASFPAEDVLFLIYEELFTQQTLDRLGSFLDLETRADFTSRQFNRSPKQSDISPGLRQEIRDFYDPVYRFCRERFPQVARLWDYPSD